MSEFFDSLFRFGVKPSHNKQYYTAQGGGLKNSNGILDKSGLIW